MRSTCWPPSTPTSSGGPARASVPQSPPGVTWRLVDVTDAADVDRAIAQDRPDVVLHLAGDAQSNRSAAQVGNTLLVNVYGRRTCSTRSDATPATRASSWLARRWCMRRRVSRSPSRRQCGPSGAYAVSKLAQEMVALGAAGHDGLDVIVARAFNHIGPRQSPRSSPRAWRGRLRSSKRDVSSRRCPSAISIHGATSPTCATWCAPTARSSLAARAGLAYNVCRGEALSVRELIDALVARARVPVKVVVDPERVRKVDIPLVLGSHARLTTRHRLAARSPVRPHARRPAHLLARAGPSLVRLRPS